MKSCLRLMRSGEKSEIAPLPQAEMTRPALYIHPHQDAVRAEQPPGRVANREEVRTGKKSSELPLVIFTVLSQMAVGAFIVLGALSGWAAQKSVWAAQYGNWLVMARGFTLSPLLVTGGVFGVGMLASLLHLGRPLRAYRALFHLLTSWLSREILSVGLFGAGLVVFLFIPPAFISLLWVVYGLTALAGLALIFCMAKVYRLSSLPFWNSWRTTASFYLTAGLLGLLLCAMQSSSGLKSGFNLFVATPGDTLRHLSISVAAVGTLLLAFDLALQGRQQNSNGQGFWLTQLRLALGIIAILPLAVMLAGAEVDQFPDLTAQAFWLALGAQLIGRWLFYERLNEKEL